MTIILYRLAERNSVTMQIDPLLGRSIVGRNQDEADDLPLWPALFALRHVHLLMTTLVIGSINQEMMESRLNVIGGCMAYCAQLLVYDLGASIDEKMGINRRRRWHTRGDGHGYHSETRKRPDENLCRNRG